MSQHYQRLLGIGVDWQLDRNLISKIKKSEKGVQKQEDVRESSSDESQEKGKEKKKGPRREK